MSGYSPEKPIDFTVVVSGGTGSTTISGDKTVLSYAIQSPSAGGSIEFLDSEGWGLAGADITRTRQVFRDEFRIGANGHLTTVTITGPNGTYTGRLWPKYL